jgi:hypothetical protein
VIARLWHGWTTPENADTYEQLLQTDILPGIERAHHCQTQMMRRDAGAEVEFITVCYFESLNSIRSFAGDDYERAVVPERARKVLKRFDERAVHFEVKRKS